MNNMVFIIILNWNGWQDTLECVASCRKLSYPDCKILVVDNGSTDGSEEKLCGNLQDIEILQTGENLGFAGGNNVGIKFALEQGADYIWLLNNDTVVDPESLSELVKVAEANQQPGIVGSKILLKDQPDTLHFAGGSVDLRIGDTSHVGAFEKDQGQYNHLSEVDYVTGSSMLIKKQVIEKIGLMAEEYFLYYEETDWCMRARKNGYSILMAPKSRVYHKVSGSIEYTSPLKKYYIVRNRLFFLNKHGENIDWLGRIKSDLLLLFRLLITRRFRHAQLICKSYFHWKTGHLGQLHNLSINTEKI